jgi:hypothetical protein
VAGLIDPRSRTRLASLSTRSRMSAQAGPTSTGSTGAEPLSRSQRQAGIAFLPRETVHSPQAIK